MEVNSGCNSAVINKAISWYFHKGVEETVLFSGNNNQGMTELSGAHLRDSLGRYFLSPGMIQKSVREESAHTSLMERRTVMYT